MMDNADFSRSRADEDGLDTLARLYREIGISAVAAALNVTLSKARAEARPAEPGLTDLTPQADKKDLAA